MLFCISTVSNGRKCYEFIFSQYFDLKAAHTIFIALKMLFLYLIIKLFCVV